MANKEKLNYTKTTRFNKSDMDYLTELEQQGINLRDVLEYYKMYNTDETKRLQNREKCLLKKIDNLKKELTSAEEELKEVRERLYELTKKY